jgi:hypothetical protein
MKFANDSECCSISAAYLTNNALCKLLSNIPTMEMTNKSSLQYVYNIIIVVELEVLTAVAKIVFSSFLWQRKVAQVRENQLAFQEKTSPLPFRGHE